MANLPQTSQWHNGIYQIEETDPVFGGPAGIANVQSKQLSDRTTWLKEQLAATTSAAALLTKLKTVDGSGTGLDADKLDGYHANHFATQAALDALTGAGFATLADVATAINDVVDGAPGALNTLAELAAALADDDTELAAIITQLAGKLATGGTAVNSEKLGGLLPDEFQDARPELNDFAPIIQDWDTAITNGWFESSANVNAPTAGHYLGEVIAHTSGWVTQTAHAFTGSNAADTKTFRRHKKAGTWHDWYRLKISQAEQDAKYQGVDYASPEITPFPSAGVETSFIHGLDATPTQYWAVLKCITASVGYSVGDEVIVTTHNSSDDSACGLSIFTRSNQIRVKIGVLGLKVIRADNGANYNIGGNANWSLIIKAKK